MGGRVNQSGPCPPDGMKRAPHVHAGLLFVHGPSGGRYFLSQPWALMIVSSSTFGA